MKNRAVIAATFVVLAFTVVDAFALSSGSRRRNGDASASTTNSTTNNLVVRVPEPASMFGLASGLLLLGGTAWLVRRK